MSYPEETDLFQFAQELLLVDIPPLDSDEWSPENPDEFFNNIGPLIDHSFPELPSQSPQVTSYQNLQDMSPPIDVNSLNPSPTGAQIKSPSSNQLTANTSSMLSQTRGTHASATSNVGQFQVQNSDSLQEDLLLIDQCVGFGHFLQDLLTARAKCIRDIQRLYVGLGAESEEEKPEETGLCKGRKRKKTLPEESKETKKMKDLTQRLQNDVKWEVDSLDVSFVKLTNKLKEAVKELATLQRLLNQLRKLALLISRQPGPVFEHKKSSAAIDTMTVRLLGSRALWSGYDSGQVAELYFLSEGSAQEVIYGRSDTGFRNNNLLVNGDQKEGLLTFHGNRTEKYTCIQTQITATRYPDPEDLSYPKSNKNLTGLEAKFALEVRRYDKDSANVNKNEDPTLLSVPLRHYYCLCKVGGFQTLSLPCLVGTHNKKQIIQSMGGRFLAETIIFCGNPDAEGRTQLPPPPTRATPWTGGWNEKVAEEVLNMRRSGEMVCGIEEVVSFLDQAFVSTTDTKRPLNSHCRRYLVERLREITKNEPVISWEQFSKKPLPKRKDISRWFSFGTWFYGNMELLKENKMYKHLYDEGMIILFAKSSAIMEILKGQNNSMSIKAADTRPPGYITLSYNAGSIKDHAAVTLENLLTTIRDLGKVGHLKGIHQTKWICGWSKEDGKKCAMYPKSDFDKISGNSDSGEAKDTGCKARKLIELVSSRKNQDYCVAGYSHELLTLVLPSMAGMKIPYDSDSDSTTNAMSTRKGPLSSGETNSDGVEHLMVLLDESLSGLLNAVNSGEVIENGQRERLETSQLQLNTLRNKIGGPTLPNSSLINNYTQCHSSENERRSSGTLMFGGDQSDSQMQGDAIFDTFLEL